MTGPAPGTAPTVPPLDGAQVARAFPFHLWLDASLQLLSVGRSLAKAMPMLGRGEPLTASFEVLRPRAGHHIDAWRQHGHALCTLRTREGVPLTLRGSAELLADGSLLLLVSPVLTSLDDIQALGLNLNDFARHDAAGELLMLARSTQTAAHDALRLAERLSQRTQQLDSILELSHHGVVAFDAQGVLRQVNGALLRMLGLVREDMPGTTLRQLQAHVQHLLSPDQPPIDFGALADAHGQVVLDLAAPRHAIVELSARVGAEGGPIFYWRDMTTEFEVDRMKSEFLSTAAHELRTPMVSIYGFTELMLHRPLDEARRTDVVRTIHRQTGQLIRMVNELLDLARIEARQGKDLAREPVAADALLVDAVQAQLGALSGHRLQVDGEPVHALILVDPAKTEQALGNVLSNAAKYSEPGTEIRIGAIPGQLAGRAAVGLRVRDRGMGMTPAQVARVFERFYRADPSGNIPGTGLGMCLVKEIVELQGGRVELVSEAGVGTTVTLWFPRHEPAVRSRRDVLGEPDSVEARSTV